MNFKNEVIILFILNGYFIIQLVLFIILIRMFIKSRNNQQHIWLSKNWRKYNLIGILLEIFFIAPWWYLGFFVSMIILDGSSQMFKLKFNLVMLISIVTFFLVIIQSIVGIIGWYKRRKYFKYK